MTLNRMLLGGLAITLLTLTLLLTFINLAASKRHLIAQQSVEVNNTANSLSFALKPLIEGRSQSHIDAVIHSMFDSNFYHSLELSFKDERPSIQYQRDTDNHPVPTWFTDLINIPTVQRSVDISTGWESKAELTVTSSPLFTYIKLWNTTVAYILIGGVFNIFALSLFSIQLKHALAPIRDLTQQLKYYPANRTFTPIEQPKAKEVATLVRAYNMMNRQIHHLISNLEGQTAELHRTAYNDELTGLYNRQYLLDTVSKCLDKPSPKGSITVFQFDQLAHYKQSRSFDHLNQHAKQLADVINNVASEVFTLTRLNDIEFALLTSSKSTSLSDQTTERLNRALAEFYRESNAEANNTGYASVTLKLSEYSSTRDLLTDLEQKFTETKQKRQQNTTNTVSSTL